MIGNVDSGKSTLVGVLTKGIFDDGRGSAREVNWYEYMVREYLTSNMKNKTVELRRLLKKSWVFLSFIILHMYQGLSLSYSRQI